MKRAGTTEKFRNKYRVPSARLPNWDYRTPGAYFITINTKNREYYFGEIENHKIRLSNIGLIADILWYEIKNHSKNVELGAFTVMPNHIHGILILNGNIGENSRFRHRRDDACIVSTVTPGTFGTPLTSVTPSSKTIIETTTPPDLNNGMKKSKNRQMAKISPKSGSVSRIIGSYKSAVSKHAHRLGFEFQWQERFYDHIIRNQESYFLITNYIINNPKNWRDDKFNRINK